MPRGRADWLRRTARRSNTGRLPWTNPHADGASPGLGDAGRSLQLDQIPKHLLRVGCRRCGRVVKIQKVDAVRLYCQDAI